MTVKLVEELLHEKHDFTLDEDMTTDPEATSYAKNDAEVREMWRDLQGPAPEFEGSMDTPTV